MSTTLLDRAHDAHHGLSLAGLGTSVLSPYYQPSHEIGGNLVRDIRFIPTIMAVTNCVASTIGSFNSDFAVDVQFFNGTTFVNEINIELTDFTKYGSSIDIYNYAVSSILAYAATQGYTAISSAANIVWAMAGIPTISLTPAPSSYQTIVSQTGAAAPAVSGGLVPTSTYPAGTIFTWARTGAGVYTLTASTAVFNTSGKTGVFVAPLQNLNAQAKAVVTSTTVITVTTAVASVAVLGLLGLTTTNTDALLSGTMLYVQTYA